MKDYLVHANDHEVEYTEPTWSEARATATQLKRSGQYHDKEVIIDQYEDNELTGVYWQYKDGKLVKEG